MSAPQKPHADGARHRVDDGVDLGLGELGQASTAWAARARRVSARASAMEARSLSVGVAGEVAIDAFALS